MKEIIKSIDLIRNNEALWKSESRSYEDINQPFKEIIDNIFGSFKDAVSEDNKIIISIHKLSDRYKFTFEDNGTGIRDLVAALSFANSNNGLFSMYGVGLKRAISYLDPENAGWMIYTRTEEDVHLGRYSLVKAPYDFDRIDIHEITESKWPGELEGTGTFIEVPCSIHHIKTISSKWDILDFFEEEISVNYAYLENICFNCEIRYTDGNSTDKRIVSLKKPKFKNIVGTINKKYDFGEGLCDLDIEYGFIEENDYTKYYYQPNKRTSGVMIYLNGRLIDYGIIDLIWDVVKHDSYNSFLMVVNVKSENKEALPPPDPTKKHLMYNDARAVNLFDEIKRNLNDLREFKNKRNYFEKEKSEKLIAKLKEIYGKSAIINTELPLFEQAINKHPKLDIYMYADNKVTFIECKPNASKPIDVFQLLMYFILGAFDRLKADHLWLLAKKHSLDIQILIRNLNKAARILGIRTRFFLKTWKDFDIE